MLSYNFLNLQRWNDLWLFLIEEGCFLSVLRILMLFCKDWLQYWIIEYGSKLSDDWRVSLIFMMIARNNNIDLDWIIKSRWSDHSDDSFNYFLQFIYFSEFVHQQKLPLFFLLVTTFKGSSQFFDLQCQHSFFFHLNFKFDLQFVRKHLQLSLFFFSGTSQLFNGISHAVFHLLEVALERCNRFFKILIFVVTSSKNLFDLIDFILFLRLVSLHEFDLSFKLINQFA